MTTRKFNEAVALHIHNFGKHNIFLANLLAGALGSDIEADKRFLEMYLPICKLDLSAFWETSQQIIKLTTDSSIPKIHNAPRTVRLIWSTHQDRYPNFLSEIAEKNGIINNSLEVLSIEQVLGRIESNLNLSKVIH